MPPAYKPTLNKCLKVRKLPYLYKFHHRHRVKEVKSAKPVQSFCSGCNVAYWQR